MDPSFINHDLWGRLTDNLMLLWGFLGSVILFAGSLLMAIAVIPSLVASGHLPASPPGPAKAVRPLFFLAAAAGAAGIVYTLSQVIPGIRDLLPLIWNRWAQ